MNTTLRLQGAVTQPELLPPTDMASVLSDWLGKPLLRVLADTSEAARTAAAALFLQCLRTGEDAVLSLLPYAVPVLEERLQGPEGKALTEPCEEVRLVLMQVRWEFLI